MKYHYQILKKDGKEGTLLYDSRVNTGFRGFATTDGANIAARAQIENIGSDPENYIINLLPQTVDYETDKIGY